MQIVPARAQKLLDLATQCRLPQLLNGISDSSGIEAASVQELARLWLSTISPASVARWLAAMRVPECAPVGNVAIIAPGNLFVATWTAMLEPWLCGNHVRVRTSSGDPLAASNLAKTLGGGGFDVRSFGRGDSVGWAALLDGANAVAVYGGDEALAAVREIAASRDFRGAVRGHGHRVSVARCSAARLQDVAESIGTDVFLADGRGCMSLRALLVPGLEIEATAEPVWVEGVFAAAERFSAGRMAMDVWAARRSFIEQARVDQALGGRVQVLERGDAAVVLDARPRSEVGLADIGPGARVLVVLPAQQLGGDLAARLARPPCSEDALGKMQAPPVWRDPDGEPVGAVFVRPRSTKA
jgi:acyl-CoA reductase-like NAD-dependent aldehyde dehydrogenase